MSTYYSSSSHNIKQKKKRGEDDLQNGAFGGCKRRKKEMSRNKDMFEELGEDLMFMVLSQLDARSAALCLLVSRHWHSVASTDRLWGPKAVPEYWQNLDPYWSGTFPLMRRYFHPDGSQTADHDDKVWGGHESCYSIVTTFVGEGKIKQHYVRINRWPQMSVYRKKDWSWGMSSVIFSYSSIPDAYKEGGTGPLHPVV